MPRFRFGHIFTADTRSRASFHAAKQVGFNEKMHGLLCTPQHSHTTSVSHIIILAKRDGDTFTFSRYRHSFNSISACTATTTPRPLLKRQPAARMGAMRQCLP